MTNKSKDQKSSKESRQYKILGKKELPGSEIELAISISWSDFSLWRKKAVDFFSKELTVPGFRKGMVPESVILEKIGEAEIIREGVKLWTEDNLLEIAEKEVPDAISAPRISITKAVFQNDVEFKMIFEKWPLFELPDYRAISKSLPKTSDVSVSEEEVEVALKDLRRAFAWQEAEKQHIQMTHEEFEKNLPEINEEWAKKMGSDSLVDLKAKIKKEITETKLYKEKQKRTSLLMEKIIEEANFSLPNIMIEEELDRMELEMKADLERMGLDFQHYLEHIKKTASDLRKDNRKTAENRAKSRLVLIKVASRENIKPDEKLVSEKVDSIIKENPSLDKEKVKNYIFHTHTLEAAWNFLENL